MATNTRADDSNLQIHEDLELLREEREAEAHEEELAKSRQLRFLRADFSHYLYWTAVIWLLTMVAIVVCDGMFEGFKPDRFTLRILAGTTSAALLGRFGQVIGFLFPRTKKPPVAGQ